MMTRRASPPPDAAPFWVSVSASIFDSRGYFLAIKRADNGDWETPGGMVEQGESIQEALRREVNEEVGISILVDRLTGVYLDVESSALAFNFSCQPTAGTAASSNEAASVQWVPVEVGLQWMREPFRFRLLDSLKIGPVRFRNHIRGRLLE